MFTLFYKMGDWRIAERFPTQDSTNKENAPSGNLPHDPSNPEFESTAICALNSTATVIKIFVFLILQK
jgi:hypothetical protein